MEKNSKIIDKLAKENKRWFIQGDFEKTGISHDEKDDLLRKGFLKESKHPITHSTVYYLSDSSYMFILSIETEKSSRATRRLTFWLLVFTGLLIILTIIQICLLLTSKS